MRISDWSSDVCSSDLNEEITASVVIARCKLTRGGSRRWKIRLDESLRPDHTICVRMDEDNMNAHDFYILTRMKLEQGVLRLAAPNRDRKGDASGKSVAVRVDHGGHQQK